MSFGVRRQHTRLVKTTPNRLIARVAALFTLLSLCGCMTRGVVGHAKMNKDGIPTEHVEQPGYYFLVPFTVVGDVVTFPIQACLHFTSKGTDVDPWQ